jgi:hypothetical protein
MNAIKVIVRLEKFNGDWRPLLVLPNTPANRGFVAFCSPAEGHGEMCHDYYRNTKPADKVTAEKWLNWYASIGGNIEPVKLAQRITLADSREAYAWRVSA